MEARLRSRRRRKWAGYSDDRGWRLLWLRVEIASRSRENRCDNSALVSRQRFAARARAAHDKSPPCRHDRFLPRYDSCRSEEHTSELQSRGHLVCRLLLEKKKTI